MLNALVDGQGGAISAPPSCLLQLRPLWSRQPSELCAILKTKVSSWFLINSLRLFSSMRRFYLFILVFLSADLEVDSKVSIVPRWDCCIYTSCAQCDLGLSVFAY